MLSLSEFISAVVEFERIHFHQSFKKCSILTPDIRKQPHASLRINLKGI